MAEPSEDAINLVLEVTTLDPYADRNLIISHLRAKNGNAEAVVAEYYEDPIKFKNATAWDESAFHASRDGAVGYADQPTFRIDGPDDNGTVIQGVAPAAGHHAAPSRPPSRNESPLGRLVDWTADSAAGMPTSRAQEDLDMKKALAESRAMSGIQSPQETGITQADTTRPAFGPATREEYDPNQWNMVLATREIPEPSPSGRKRTEGVPAFLRCRKTGWDAHRLGGILTIFHEIPAARNTLLLTGVPSANYGTNNEWWKGTPIVQKPPSEQQWQVSDGPVFAEELHRLMAFLDSTDRSYGTADTLGDLRIVKGPWDSNDEKLFFHALQEIKADDFYFPAGLFWSRVDTIKVDDPDERVSTDGFAIFDLDLAFEQWARVENLYNALDVVIWPAMSSEEDEANRNQTAVFETIGDVLTFRFTRAGIEQPFHIPATLYLDRYLREHQEDAATLQKQLTSVYRALEKAISVQDSLTVWLEKDGRVRDRRDICRFAVDYYQQELWSSAADAAWSQHEQTMDTPQKFDFSLSDVHTSGDLDSEDKSAAGNSEAYGTIHEDRIEGINRKLEKLKAEQVACQTLIQRLSMRLTEPSEAEGWNPSHRYTLRGVAVSSEVMYVCRRAEANLIELEDTPSGPDQWWKLAYLSQLEEPIQTEKITLDDVLKAACEEGDRKPILIYANDKAMDANPEPLSDALRTFVRFDNRLFKQEVIEETPREKRPSDGTPASPPKRHQRESSIDSIATNRASLGDSDRDDLPDIEMIDNVEDEGFHNHDGTLGTEMVQLAISRPLGTAEAGQGEGDGQAQKQSNVIADWDNPEGKMPAVYPKATPAVNPVDFN